MAITNGYVTLAEFKDWLQLHRSYTAATLSFATATKKIADTRKGLKRFQTGGYVQVSGSVANDGYYNIATGNVPAEIVTTEALVDAIAGPSVTITDVSDMTDDPRLERDIEAASRMVDQFTGRRFYSTSADETRYYAGALTDVLFVDDLLSVTTLKTDEDGDRTYELTWATTDYVLEPYNATLEGRPYTRVRVDENNGRYWFPAADRKCVEIVGKFGYCLSTATPAKVKEATLLQANRLGKRPGSPFGVAGAPEFGQLVMLKDGMDPDAALLLREFIRMV